MPFRTRRTRRWFAVAVAITVTLAACVVVLALRHSERFNGGTAPQQFDASLGPGPPRIDPDLLSVAHNAGNSLNTLRTAQNNGADVIEVDVVSARGRLVAGREPLFAWISNRIFRAPSLTQVWNATETAALKLDLKQNDAGYLKEIVDFLAPRQRSRRVLIATPDTGALHFLRARLAHVELLASLSNPDALRAFRADRRQRSDVDGASVFEGLVNPAFVTWMHNQHLLVLAWPVNGTDVLSQMASAKVDGVTTANLAILRELAGTS